MSQVVMHSGYNDHGIRVGVIVPLENGAYGIPGVYLGGGSPAYGGGLPLQRFDQLANAQRYFSMRNPCTAIRWVEEVIEQVVASVA